ncbi:MAG: YceI family protein [Bacteroidetes bacterium]|nr:YceI family protein [Bacteroidota bacterium]
MKRTWKIDTAHSEVQFKVRHMMISNVTGNFSSFDSTVTTDNDDFKTAQARFEADLSSISTNNEQRDNHLRTSDFFDAANHPKLEFVSKKMEQIDEENFLLTGDLTIRGTTKPITLKVEFGGTTLDPWGNTRVGFSIEGKLNRKEYGLNWSAMTEAGGMVVSDEVRLFVNAEFIKQSA